jgi:hypothetical protein
MVCTFLQRTNKSNNGFLSKKKRFILMQDPKYLSHIQADINTCLSIYLFQWHSRQRRNIETQKFIKPVLRTDMLYIDKLLNWQLIKKFYTVIEVKCITSCQLKLKVGKEKAIALTVIRFPFIINLLSVNEFLCLE